MNFTLSSKAIASLKADCIVVAVPESGDWPASTVAVDEALGGLLRQLNKSGDITGKNAPLIVKLGIASIRGYFLVLRLAQNVLPMTKNVSTISAMATGRLKNMKVSFCEMMTTCWSDLSNSGTRMKPMRKAT